MGQLRERSGKTAKKISTPQWGTMLNFGPSSPKFGKHAWNRITNLRDLSPDTGPYFWDERGKTLNFSFTQTQVLKEYVVEISVFLCQRRKRTIKVQGGNRVKSRKQSRTSLQVDLTITSWGLHLYGVYTEGTIPFFFLFLTSPQWKKCIWYKCPFSHGLNVRTNFIINVQNENNNITPYSFTTQNAKS